MKNSKQFIFLFLLFVGEMLIAQESVIINGKVIDEKQPLQGVHIQNLERNRFTITDTEGNFSIEAFLGNTLKITYVGKETIYRVITRFDLETDQLLLVKMKDELIKIEEVEVSKNPDINAQSLGILQHKPIERTYNEKRVYSETRILPSGLWPLLVGAVSVNFEGLINAITGKSKKIKQLVANDENVKVANYIIENMSTFLRKTVRLTDEEIEKLSYFVMEKPQFHDVIKAKNHKMLEFMLVDAWIELQQNAK
ncbi:carboxypeptidase-like regulatory domain-containing protein [Capnocytophaga cynodegmi]|uniref:carboxypeptidase-like regulatory domain-containing protein n=1 Tax=Capnocytophaga cynodegmi TaxID=28189 RepID=UPI00385FA213